MRFDGIIFDFDGVLLESEFAGNRHLAALLTDLGFATTIEEALTYYTGLSGSDFIDAIEDRIGQVLPPEFHTQRAEEDARILAEGLEEVVGAITFVGSLPAPWPKAVASSSSTEWVSTHLKHLGLRAAFGDNIFSGREHVERGKPSPDIYWHAAQAIGVDIRRAVIIEDSPVGAKGAVASGAHVIGLIAGSHCLPGHADTLRALGVHDIATTFDEIARLTL